MGTGTDVAMQSAGITLVKGDLRGIAKAIRLSHAIMRNIRILHIYRTGGTGPCRGNGAANITSTGIPATADLVTPMGRAA